jgi:DNA processing protein
VLAAHPDLRTVFDLPRRDLFALGLSSRSVEGLQNPDLAGVESDLAWLEQPDHHLLRIDEPAYPELLRSLDDPPPLLFVAGEPRLLGLPQLAVVGSRNPTRGGADNAREFARHLAAAGVPITSGLALGVDAAAHEGALAGGGVTIAVVGTGLDRVYPARHRALAHRIAEQGALVSEYPLGVGVRPENFPRRNRIISGLSLGTLVVEASLRSGSLITARLAMEQGREVFAIPGSIHNPLARGCHALIRQGAKLVETAADILEELPNTAPVLVPPLPASVQAGDERPRLDADYERVLAALGHDPTPFEVVLEHTRLTPAEVSSILLVLELEGHVAACAGGRYALIRRPYPERDMR